MTDIPDPLDSSPDAAPPVRGRVSRRSDLEDRVRKLEASVGELKESAVTEEGVTDRVISRLQAMAAPRPVLYDAAGPVGEELAVPDPTPVPEPPRGAVLEPPLPPPPSDPARRTWFLFQLLGEIRLTVRMYFDPRYRVSRTAQFAVPVVAGLFALNYFFFAVWFSIAFVSPILERLVGILLAIFLYKVLTRELARYRDVLDYYAKHPPR